MQTNSQTNAKTDIAHINCSRIPIVPSPYTINSSKPSVPPSSLVIPLPHEISQLPNSGNQETKQNVSIRVENPFECLASFYFPEHVDMTGGVGVPNVATNTSLHDYVALGNMSEYTELQEAEEEFKMETQTAPIKQYNYYNQNKVIDNDEKMSDIVTSVPELVKILQTKSQKKIILEVRS